MSLLGHRILLTQAAEDQERWSQALRAQGAELRSLPCLRTEPLPAPDPSELERLLLSHDALVFTSRRGVERLRACWRGALPEHLRLFAVGPRTDEALSTCFRAADLRGAGGGASLAQSILQQSSLPRPLRLLHPCAESPHPGLRETLGERAQLRELPLYRVCSAGPVRPRLRLQSWELSAALLCSPSAARGLLQQAELPTTLPLLAIGPSTAEVLRAAGLQPMLPRRPGLQPMLELLRHTLSNHPA